MKANGGGSGGSNGGGGFQRTHASTLFKGLTEARRNNKNQFRGRDPTSFHIKIWIRLPLLIFLLNLPASSPRSEPWENARAQPAGSFAQGKFLQRSWLATPPNGEPARWLLLTLLSLKRTLSVKCLFPHYLSPPPGVWSLKKKQKKTYLSRKEQITRLITRNIASIRPMVKLQIFNCENSIIKSYLFRCRNSTFFAGVSCDQTKKKLILFSIIKSLKTDTNKSRKI